LWDQEFVDAEVEGFFEFKKGSTGAFQFGHVSGEIDYEEAFRDGKPAIEFTWDGNDEMDPAQGCGWAVSNGDEIEGRIFFHQSDDSAFKAETFCTAGKRSPISTAMIAMTTRNSMSVKPRRPRMPRRTFESINRSLGPTGLVWCLIMVSSVEGGKQRARPRITCLRMADRRDTMKTTSTLFDSPRRGVRTHGPRGKVPVYRHWELRKARSGAWVDV